jgi:SSS family transporter
VYATAFSLGQSSVVVAGGGETASVPFELPPAGSVVSATPLLYNVVTDAWCDFDQPLSSTTSVSAVNVGNLLDRKTLLIGNAPGEGALRVQEFKVIRDIRTLTWLDYLVIVLYFGFISCIGVWASRKQKTSADFSLAGRQVPWWVAGISMFATGASAISFMAIPALAFASNLVFLFPIGVLILSYFVQAHAIYPLLRRLEITSTYEYLEKRFNKTLRLIASAQCIAFQTFGRASIVLVLPSLAISATTGISVYVSVLVMGVITTLYTALGGFNAVVYTDVFQGLLKFTAPLCMIAVCIFSLPGGVHEFVSVGMSHHKFDYALFTWDATLPALWILVLGTFLATTIQQAGDQPVIQRVFSSPEKEVRRVAAMSTACGILIACVVNVLGVAIFMYFRAHPTLLDPLAQNDKIVPLFVVQALPHGAVGVVIAAIFASAMTTVASSMNSSATVFTEDFFMRFNPDASDKLRVRVLRTTSYVVGLIAIGIALLLATLNLKSIMVVWSQISALLGGGIVGVYSLGMFTRRANGFGAVGGALISVVVTALVQFQTPLHWQTLMPIAILSCMFFGYLLSLFSPQKKDITGLTIYTSSKAKT